MNETEMTQRLDESDLLEVAHGPGVYCLALNVPSMPTVAREQWDAHHDARPGEDAIERLASAQAPLYVGAASEIYDRLTDHAAGVRVPAVCQAFPPTHVVDVWPHEAPFDGPEVNRALALAREDEYVVWCNGEVWG